MFEAGPTVERAGTARTPFEALENDLPRRVHPRAVHGNSPAPYRIRFAPDRTPTGAGSLIGSVCVEGSGAWLHETDSRVRVRVTVE